MTEIERILDQLKRAFEGGAWHGPSVKEVLAGVTAEQAARKPLAGAHSIWEITLHIAAWERGVSFRLQDRKRVELSDEEDWPAVKATTEAAWIETLSDLQTGHKKLCDEIAKLSDADLDDKLQGDHWSVYQTLHGVIQHDLYHAGQIRLLSKALK